MGLTNFEHYLALLIGQNNFGEIYHMNIGWGGDQYQDLLAEDVGEA